MTREPGRELLRPKARSEEEQYQWKDITTTSDKACGHKKRAPKGLRRRKTVCFVAPPLRIVMDTRRSSLLASSHAAPQSRPRFIYERALNSKDAA
jgi:hypothetical protein